MARGHSPVFAMISGLTGLLWRSERRREVVQRPAAMVNHHRTYRETEILTAGTFHEAFAAHARVAAAGPRGVGRSAEPQPTQRSRYGSGRLSGGGADIITRLIGQRLQERLSRS
jgi:hypothetical protein